MDDFLRYFENKEFVRWVYHPTPELNDYWNNWFKNHPEDNKNAEFARLALLQLQSKKENVSSEELAVIYSEINLRIINSRKNQKSNRFLLTFSRYAAVALFFLSLGVLLTYQLKFKNHNEYSASKVVVADDAQLILSDGREIVLKSKESLIEYGEKGKIVINHKDTITRNDKQTDSEMNKLIVPYGKTSLIKLPDGTLAHLNAGSSLMYPSFFEKNKREIFLSGEGYFEVAHNPEKPFIVKTNALDVTAIGTIFNVSAYPADKIIETVLVEGKVILADRSLLFKKDYTLSPNELAIFDRESQKTITKVIDVNQYVAWHNGYLGFQSTDLSRIVRQLERFYNIRFHFEDPMLGHLQISGKLELKEDRNEVIERIARTASVQIVRKADDSYLITK